MAHDKETTDSKSSATVRGVVSSAPSSTRDDTDAAVDTARLSRDLNRLVHTASLSEKQRRRERYNNRKRGAVNNVNNNTAGIMMTNNKRKKPTTAAALMTGGSHNTTSVGFISPTAAASSRSSKRFKPDTKRRTRFVMDDSEAANHHRHHHHHPHYSSSYSLRSQKPYTTPTTMARDTSDDGEQRDDEDLSGVLSTNNSTKKKKTKNHKTKQGRAARKQSSSDDDRLPAEGQTSSKSSLEASKRGELLDCIQKAARDWELLQNALTSPPPLATTAIVDEAVDVDTSLSGQQDQPHQQNNDSGENKADHQHNEYDVRFGGPLGGILAGANVPFRHRLAECSDRYNSIVDWDEKRTFWLRLMRDWPGDFYVYKNGRYVIVRDLSTVQDKVKQLLYDVRRLIRTNKDASGNRDK